MWGVSSSTGINLAAEWFLAPGRARSSRPLSRRERGEIRGRLVGPDQPHHLTLFGKAMGGFLGKNKPAVHPDVKHAATPFGEFRVHGISVLQLRGQTGRVGKVISNTAIENIDVHALLLGLRFRATL